MNASAAQSAVHSTKAFLAVASAHAVQDSIPALNWQQLCAVFGLAFVIEIFNWLDAHPLTELLANTAGESPSGTGGSPVPPAHISPQ